MRLRETAEQVAGLAARWSEDASLAKEYALFTAIGGSVLLPRTVRRALYRAAGATMQSPPGVGFALVGSPRNLSVGPGVYMNRGVYIEAIAPVSIGAYCPIGMGAMIVTSHHPYDEHGEPAGETEGRPVSIGDRVWIGARALILPGAVIESNVIIAAGAVVSGHCRAGGVYGGVPARLIRSFDRSAGPVEPTPDRAGPTSTSTRTGQVSDSSGSSRMRRAGTPA